MQFSATLRGWVTLFYYIDRQQLQQLLHLLYKTQPAGIIAKILTNLLCEKVQKGDRPYIYTGVEPLTFFFFWLLRACPLMIFLFCKEMIGGSLKIY